MAAAILSASTASQDLAVARIFVTHRDASPVHEERPPECEVELLCGGGTLGGSGLDGLQGRKHRDGILLGPPLPEGPAEQGCEGRAQRDLRIDDAPRDGLLVLELERQGSVPDGQVILCTGSVAAR